MKILVPTDQIADILIVALVDTNQRRKYLRQDSLYERRNMIRELQIDRTLLNVLSRTVRRVTCTGTLSPIFTGQPAVVLSRVRSLLIEVGSDR